MKHQPVYLEWLDSNRALNGWENKKNLPALPIAKCESTGFILEETDEYITIAQNVNESQVLGRISIPKIAIIVRRHPLWKVSGK